MCKVSIIVPMYNGERTIRRCLDSLVKQSLKEIEILVVNDGSTDHGAELVQEYILKDSRIRLISQKNQGQGAARNLGIREAAGEYLGFVDADDFVDQDMYKHLLEAIEAAGTNMAICQEKHVYVENGRINVMNETKYPTDVSKVYTSEVLLKWLLNYTYMSLNSMCNKLVKREVFAKNEISVPEQYRYAEDMVTSVELIACLGNAVIVPESLYYYVHVKDSFTYSYSLKHAVDIYKDWADIKKHLEKYGYKGNTDNFSLGMQFSSLKQLEWMKETADKKEVDELKKKWKILRSKEHWKPNFRGIEMPIAHKIKVYVAYFNVCPVVLALISKLKWIPFFKYLA